MYTAQEFQLTVVKVWVMVGGRRYVKYPHGPQSFHLNPFLMQTLYMKHIMYATNTDLCPKMITKKFSVFYIVALSETKWSLLEWAHPVHDSYTQKS